MLLRFKVIGGAIGRKTVAGGAPEEGTAEVFGKKYYFCEQIKICEIRQ
jgi:hypothetical protein